MTYVIRDPPASLTTRHYEWTSAIARHRLFTPLSITQILRKSSQFDTLDKNMALVDAWEEHNLTHNRDFLAATAAFHAGTNAFEDNYPGFPAPVQPNNSTTSAADTAVQGALPWEMVNPPNGARSFWRHRTTGEVNFTLQLLPA